MQYKVTVNGQVYEVKIENINARPVVAYVGAERFEIMPEETPQAETSKAAPPNADKKIAESNPSTTASANPVFSGNVLTAPLPGTALEIFVKAGDRVEIGQVLLVIEAMKMKNSIRSTFSGTVEQVLISSGQSVAHKQALLKFAEQG
ncbi:MAG: biotin/lipoyl-binding protein [Anaerolineales bacterium]|nr:biotin/lipoyl-binding protein [Anaerolineales bacterium]MCZ2121185.1 biotin/lipoyl-binding protein [Anaerolineales bacterium]